MRAIQAKTFGGPDALALAELPDPVPGLGNIVIDLLPLGEAETAHRRMENRSLDGRIVLKMNS